MPIVLLATFAPVEFPPCSLPRLTVCGMVLAPEPVFVVEDGGDRPLAAKTPDDDDVGDDLPAEARGGGRSGSGGKVRYGVA